MLEVEISLGIIIRNVSYHLFYKGHLLGWQLAIFDILANHIAELATEILVAWIGEERTAVGKHAHEATQESEYAEGIHLSLHTIQLIVEPPSATKLNLAWCGTFLEVAYHGGNHLVVSRVDALQNSLGQKAFAV